MKKVCKFVADEDIPLTDVLMGSIVDGLRGLVGANETEKLAVKFAVRSCLKPLGACPKDFNFTRSIALFKQPLILRALADVIQQHLGVDSAVAADASPQVRSDLEKSLYIYCTHICQESEPVQTELRAVTELAVATLISYPSSNMSQDHAIVRYFKYCLMLLYALRPIKFS
jgi:hypothetical protein